MDQEIKNAKILGCLVFISIDANAKLGGDIIAGDPHPMSQNGEYLLNLIELNNLVICNTDKNCEGLFTRERNTVKSQERSIIDFIFVCQEMHLYFEKMKIDSINALRKYSKKGDQVSVKKSDHHLLISHFNVKWSQRQKFTTMKRSKQFNFRSDEGWKTYKYLTSSNQLTNCIKGVNIQEECRIWLKKLKNILH